MIVLLLFDHFHDPTNEWFAVILKRCVTAFLFFTEWLKVNEMGIPVPYVRPLLVVAAVILANPLGVIVLNESRTVTGTPLLSAAVAVVLYREFVLRILTVLRHLVRSVFISPATGPLGPVTVTSVRVPFVAVTVIGVLKAVFFGFRGLSGVTVILAALTGVGAGAVSWFAFRPQPASNNAATAKETGTAVLR